MSTEDEPGRPVAEDGYDEAEPTSSLPAPVREVLDQIGDDLALLLTVTIPPLERARRLAVALEQETAEAARVIQALLNHSSITTTSWVQDTTAVMDAQNWLDQYQRG